MPSGYRIRLAARNEGLEYRDEFETYRFDVSLTGREWVVHMPPTKGEFMTHEMSESEENRVLPRVVGYLKTIYWFGIFPRRYTVRVVRGSR
jgi:hypothetical protein